MQNTKPHAAMLASPGMGHLIPVLELGKRLITHHNFQVTIFIVASDSSTTKSLLKSTNPNLTIVALPLVDIPALVNPNDNIVTKIVVFMRQSLPFLRSSISAMKSRPTVLVVDLFGTEAFPIADEFHMLKYVFVTSNEWFLAIAIYSPTVHNLVQVHVNRKQPLEIPGFRPVRFEDTIEAYPIMNFDRVYGEFSRVGIEIPMSDGILINTWEDLDPSTLEALRDDNKLGNVTRVPVYPVGPLVRPVEFAVHGNPEILKWLELQPSESVIYVSFGSGGTISEEQMIELAWGLELSQQRFIWVVRPPVNGDVSASYFTVGQESDAIKSYFPDGFLSRTHNKAGLVVPIWAPQREILAHVEVGGFLTHCGWNSSLESITNGVPMIAWPLYAEQKLNAALLAEELRVAVRPKTNPTEGIIGREEIEMMVRNIMEDKEMRNRVKMLKNSAEKALSKGGTSYNSLSLVAKEIKVHGF
ncbi:hypothetical protein JCGZ_12263 [Jatropha curcas]|uniref:Glycosyltransferase n=1 Tax=Jatropha curcas TaxID=180498 RepID=A0A067K6S8_JATCU|nr:UDP-glycosyltransferase 72E1 [Jatropha curcas]KDP31802.1 hypothetical protein JCGZ_12263 [Jatropha curcas]